MGGDLTYRYQDGWSVFELTLPAAEGAVNEPYGPDAVTAGSPAADRP